jgi:hypothetical protein
MKRPIGFPELIVCFVLGAAIIFVLIHFAKPPLLW